MRLHVLAVDDNADTLASVALLLNIFGHRVRVARDGPAAPVAVTDEIPDVVLLDIGLPVMDGYSVAQRIREYCGPRPYIIAVTGHGREEDRERSHRAGIDVHLLALKEISCCFEEASCAARPGPNVLPQATGLCRRRWIAWRRAGCQSDRRCCRNAAFLSAVLADVFRSAFFWR